MGLFDKFKKCKPVNTDKESLGDVALKLAKAGVISVPEDDNHNSFGEELDHLVDGELPWGWYSAKQKFIDPRDKHMMDLHIRACQATSVKDQKMLIEEFLDAFYKFKNECEKLGECYVKYFEDSYEKCHNSTDDCFSLAVRQEERLAKIMENYDELVAQEELKEKLLVSLDKDVFRMISNNPEIMQSELIKSFNPIVKNEISSLLYEWDKSGRIVREKQGRSYKLKVNEK